MSRKHLALAAWLCLAAFTFVVGWTLRPIWEMSDAAAKENPVFVGETARPSGLESQGRSAEPGGAVSGDADLKAPTRFLDSRRALNSAEIEELGQKFRAELDPVERRLAFAQLLAGLTKENALEIREQLKRLDPGSPEFREFHYAWGKVGGLDAVMKGADTKKPDMEATLAGWASADPDAAMKWFGSLDAEGNDSFAGQEDLKMGLVRGLSNADLGLATQFVLELAAGSEPKAERMLGLVTGKVLQSLGPVEAAAWAESLPAGSLRTSAMGKVAYGYSSQDPEAAAAWAGSFVHEEGGGRIALGVANEWARSDGAAAVAWLDSLGDASDQSDAYRAAFAWWADKDPFAASEYLVQMPSSTVRDEAISGLVKRHRWDDPVASIAWAESISSEEARLEALTRAAEAWTYQDPAAAAEWATSSGLPENLQQAILNAPRKGRR